MSLKELNQKQLTFVHEYHLTGNATQSAIKAGYSSKAASAIGSRLLSNAKVQGGLQELRSEAKATFKIEEEKVIKELACLAFFNPKLCLDWTKKDGVTWKDLKDIPEDTARAFKIWGTPSKKGGSVSITIGHDKAQALQLLGDKLGMWKEKKDAGSDSGDGSNRETVTQRVNRLFGEYKKRRGSKGGSDSEGSNGP